MGDYLACFVYAHLVFTVSVYCLLLITAHLRKITMTDQELKDLVAGLAVAQAKTDAQMAKTDAGFAEIRAAQAKTDAQMAKTDAQMAETAAQMAETAAQMAKTDAAMKRTDAKFANMLEMLTGISTSQGLVSEEFFYNCLADTLTVAGIKYDTIDKNIKQKVNGKWLEVDLLSDVTQRIAL
jgi:septal ring factor EnvC (AmiA/AmiB activator)